MLVRMLGVGTAFAAGGNVNCYSHYKTTRPSYSTRRHSTAHPCTSQMHAPSYLLLCFSQQFGNGTSLETSRYTECMHAYIFSHKESQNHIYKKTDVIRDHRGRQNKPNSKRQYHAFSHMENLDLRVSE